MPDPDHPGPVPDPTFARTVPASLLVPGGVLGGRYRLVERLGRGGMGEVWRAHDQKLRLDVALKAVLPGVLPTERARELLRDEVRAARQVVSPSVCRIYDLVEVADLELVSMEFVEGRTLTDLLTRESPLPTERVLDIARQFLAGLDAIHAAGLVHRDVKPDNVMISRAGRVVVMDFGVTRAQHDERRTVSGTPAYMAPEQARGAPLDPRADLYSAGVVLAEMTHPDGVRDAESRSRVLEGLRQDPPALVDGPWRPVLRRALARDPDERYPDARSLLQALERLRPGGEDEEGLQPYPGLRPFTADTARFFFGREVEVEQVWRRIAQAHLLAVVGPSGAGKSSFLRAGVLPARPEGWRLVFAAPGDRPFRALASAMLPELGGDEASLRELLDLEDTEVAVRLFSRWRQRHEEALLVLDQFEELFTQNLPDVQASFARLIGRIVLDADVRVLLSLRDDFLLRCQEYEDLAPVFADLTPLQAPGGPALRRAIEQPALKCGYHFEDDALVGEMVEDVAGERGALPLLAFAMASLWERRDRERNLLTRAAHEQIGGVGGALARHAEATLERIGSNRVGVVRELFSNLVTADGTRAARDRDELLSVFEEPATADEVLRELVDARLLTSYEPDEEASARIEIVHESLLRAWPRLVRWQTQDAEGALLREQLRQVARMWEDRGRPDDLLWSGTAYREFQLWRERYVGGLTAVEREYSAAMIRRAEAARRRRRWAVTASFATVLVVLAVVGLSWRRAAEQARIAQASELVALGRGELARSPVRALAHARASLGLRDSEAARTLALEAAWREPPTFTLPAPSVPWVAEFSPDDQWLAAGYHRGELWLHPAGGGPPVEFEGHASLVQFARFHPDRPWLVTGSQDPDPSVRIWEVPSGQLVKALPFDRMASAYWADGGRSLLTLADADDGLAHWARWSVDDFRCTPLEATNPITGYILFPMADPTGTRRAYFQYTGASVTVSSLDGSGPRPLTLDVDGGVTGIAWSRDGRELVVLSDAGSVRLVDVAGPQAGREREIGVHPSAWMADMDPGGRHLATAADGGTVRRWTLHGPPAAVDPGFRVGFQQVNGVRFSHDGQWLAVVGAERLEMRSVRRDPVLVLRAYEDGVAAMAIHPSGEWMVTVGMDARVRSWALTDSATPPRLGGEFPDAVDAALSADGTGLAVCGVGGAAFFDLKSGEMTTLDDCGANLGSDTGVRLDVALDSSATTVITAGRFNAPALELCVIDLATGEPRAVPAAPDESITEIRFLPDGRLLCGTRQRLNVWDRELGGFSEVVELPTQDLSVDRDGARALVLGAGRATVVDLATGDLLELPFHAGHTLGAISSDGAWVATADQRAGEIRVSPSGGGRGHRYLRHEGGIATLAFDPKGRWLISGGLDGTLRFWPLPDSEPWHDLPREEFVRRLDTLTNLRLVEDDETGEYRLRLVDFPGWAVAPEW